MTGSILVTGGVCLLAVGFSLILFVPPRSRFNLHRWLEQTWRVERFVYRHHRQFGSFIVLSALVLMLILSFYYNQPVATLAKSAASSARLLALVQLVSWILSGCALVIGVLVFIRPSKLKRFEQFANRWIEPVSKGELTNETEQDSNTHRSTLTGIVIMVFGVVSLVAGYAIGLS